MKKEEYIQTQISIIEAGKLIATLRLDEFLLKTTQAENAGPTLDPVLFEKAQSSINALKELTASMIPVQGAFKNFFEKVFITATQNSTGLSD